MEKMEGFMDVSKKLLLFFTLTQILQIPTTITAHATDPIDEPEMIISQTDLVNKLYSKEPTVIMLKSVACPHCTALEKEYRLSAKKHHMINFYTATNSAQLPLISTIKSVDSSLKIPGFPTLIFVYNGKIVDHQIGGNPTKMNEKLQALRKLASGKNNKSK